MPILADKKILITGIASKKSIAYGIAKAMHEQGAQLAFTYQNERLKSRVEAVAEEFGSSICLPLDVTQQADLDNLQQALSEQWGILDGVVHAIAYAPANELQGKITDSCTREGFQIAHDISAYSLIALAQACQALLEKAEQSSIITLTYNASQQTVPSYNVMAMAKASLEAGVRYLAADMGLQGVRVNAISAGPIKTLAAAGIKNFRTMLNQNANKSALGRNVTIEEVGNTAAFLASPLSSGITGEILYVDAGYRNISMSAQSLES